MKASDLLVRCLENEGVEFLFGLPGEETLDVMDSLLNARIRFIGTRHEQGAAFMADVYGRLSGKAGVCLRSEERRVGKECRSRWTSSHHKKRTNRKAR